MSSVEKTDHISSERKSSAPGTIPEGFVYREQRGRYPWWVKSVDTITVQTDADAIRKPVSNMILKGVMGKPELLRQREGLSKKVKNGAPGYSLTDVSLEFASQTYFQSGVSLDGELINSYRGLRKIISQQVHSPEEFGVDPWQGSEEETSALVEKAALHLGAVQVGFTALDLTWQAPHMSVSSEVDVPSASREKGIQFPPDYKYVIVVAGRVPMLAARCAPGAVGSAADRSGYEDAHLAEEKLMNFIRGLGYGAYDIHMYGANPIPFSLMAGMGEMGRTNRLISPYLGGTLRFALIVTDLPLALDKPIDFGLQEFCRHCRKCAKSCPVNAISFDKDPSWEPQGFYSAPGKKVWYEN